MELGSDDLVVSCQRPHLMPRWPECSVCGQVAYRIVTANCCGVQKEIPLCGRHFIDACVLAPGCASAAQCRSSVKRS